MGFFTKQTIALAGVVACHTAAHFVVNHGKQILRTAEKTCNAKETCEILPCLDAQHGQGILFLFLGCAMYLPTIVAVIYVLSHSRDDYLALQHQQHLRHVI